MRASLALLPSRKPTPASCLDSSPDHRIFPPSISPAFVHLISAIPNMSHLYLFISSCRSCIFPASLRVRTFHVPTDNIVLAILIFLSVADFSAKPRLLGGARGLCFSGRRPSRHEFSRFPGIRFHSSFFFTASATPLIWQTLFVVFLLLFLIEVT